MYNLTIPKPCFENWEQMLPNEKGRHCNACTKTVIDFTVMTDDEVKNYFLANSNNSVCGRFKNKQLQRIQIELPQNIFRLEMAFWKKYLAILLICFGNSFLNIDAAFTQTKFPQEKFIVTEQTNKKKAKKKHKRNKRLNRYLISFNENIYISSNPLWPDNISMHTVGFTVTEPQKQCLSDLIFKQPIYDSNILSVTTNIKELESKTPNPTEPPKNPPTKNEMVLTTSSFAIRKYMFKEKKV